MNTGDYQRKLSELLARHPECLPFGLGVAEVQVMAGREPATARRRRPTASSRSPRGNSIYITLTKAQPHGGASGVPAERRAGAQAGGRSALPVQLASELQWPATRARSAPGASQLLRSRPASDGNSKAPEAAPDRAESRLTELVQALDAAARQPGHSFVALKWFRDAFLPRQGFAWAQSAEARDRVLREATLGGSIRVNRIPNPRNPGFPTSVLLINADNAEVRRILGLSNPHGWDFEPIVLEGESASETLRKMREEEEE